MPHSEKEEKEQIFTNMKWQVHTYQPSETRHKAAGGRPPKNKKPVQKWRKEPIFYIFPIYKGEKWWLRHWQRANQAWLRLLRSKFGDMCG